MKASLLFSLFSAVVLVSPAFSADEKRATDQRTIGEKTSDALEKAGEKTKDAGRAVVDGSKKAVEAVKDAVTPDADAARVNVTLSEKSIDLPKHVAAGKTAFVVRNSSSVKQNFEIRGEGIEKKFLLDVEPSDTKTLNVDLKPGSYTVHIPEIKGTEATILVK